MCSFETALNQSHIVKSIVKNDMMGTQSCKYRKEVSLKINGELQTYIACTCQMPQYIDTPIGCSEANYMCKCWLER